MTDRTTEQLAQDYSAMGDSISLITDVIAGDSMADEEAEDRQDCVDRDRKSTRLNSSHSQQSRMPSSA